MIARVLRPFGPCQQSSQRHCGEKPRAGTDPGRLVAWRALEQIFQEIPLVVVEAPVVPVGTTRGMEARSYRTSTLMVLLLASSDLGMEIFNTPFSKDASVFSLWALAGSVNERWKEP